MWHHRRTASSAAASSAFAASLTVAILCTAPARAQTYTWTGATDTNFNAPANYAGGSFTFPTSGTLQLLSGTGPTANLPVLTSSATAGQIRLNVTAAQTGAFNFLSSNAAAILSLTNATAFHSSGNTVPANVGVNLALAGAGDQTINVHGATTFSGTISGGGAGRFLTLTGNQNTPGAIQTVTLSNAANSFDSTVVVAGLYNNSTSAREALLTVNTLGMAGSASSLGTSGTIVLDSFARLMTATSAVPQTTDKSFVLRKNALLSGTYVSVFGINSGPAGTNTSYSTLYGTNLPPLTLTGSVTTEAWAGSGTTTSQLWLGQSGTMSGLIADTANHKLRVASYGVQLTNPNNTFSGGFLVGNGGTLGAGIVQVPVLGMTGQPSYLGSGSSIQLNQITGTRARISSTRGLAKPRTRCSRCHTAGAPSSPPEAANSFCRTQPR
jgi:hypothetical protein